MDSQLRLDILGGPSPTNPFQGSQMGHPIEGGMSHRLIRVCYILNENAFRWRYQTSTIFTSSSEFRL
jgi:hypothetical protein